MWQIFLILRQLLTMPVKETQKLTYLSYNLSHKRIIKNLKRSFKCTAIHYALLRTFSMFGVEVTQGSVGSGVRTQEHSGYMEAGVFLFACHWYHCGLGSTASISSFVHQLLFLPSHCPFHASETADITQWCHTSFQTPDWMRKGGRFKWWLLWRGHQIDWPQS